MHRSRIVSATLKIGGLCQEKSIALETSSRTAVRSKKSFFIWNCKLSSRSSLSWFPLSRSSQVTATRLHSFEYHWSWIASSTSGHHLWSETSILSSFRNASKGHTVLSCCFSDRKLSDSCNSYWAPHHRATSSVAFYDYGNRFTWAVPTDLVVVILGEMKYHISEVPFGKFRGNVESFFDHFSPLQDHFGKVDICVKHCWLVIILRYYPFSWLLLSIAWKTVYLWSVLQRSLFYTVLERRALQSSCPNSQACR